MARNGSNAKIEQHAAFDGFQALVIGIWRSQRSFSTAGWLFLGGGEASPRRLNAAAILAVYAAFPVGGKWFLRFRD